jgi:predicted dehydrogenase
MNKIKVAFLGGGLNSAVGLSHSVAIEMDKYFSLVSGAFSRDHEINLQTAIKYKIDTNRVYENLDELIKHEKTKIDAICILTPTPNHKEEVLKCIKSGIKVICEKSLSLSSAEAREIKASLEEHDGFLSVTYNYTGYPMLRELKQLIAIEKIGRIKQVHIEMPQEGFSRIDANGNYVKPQDWRLRDNKIPTISLDLGVHIHNIMSFLTGESPIEAVTSQGNFGTFKGVVDNSISIVHYTNEIIANIWYSKVALGHRNGLRVRVYGEVGSFEWYQSDPENLHFNDNQGNKLMLDRSNINTIEANYPRYSRFKVGHPSGFIEAFANYYTDIAHAILEESNDADEYLFDIDHIIEGLSLLEAMSHSSITRQWVKI